MKNRLQSWIPCFEVWAQEIYYFLRTSVCNQNINKQILISGRRNSYGLQLSQKVELIKIYFHLKGRFRNRHSFPMFIGTSLYSLLFLKKETFIFFFLFFYVNIIYLIQKRRFQEEDGLCCI